MSDAGSGGPPLYVTEADVRRLLAPALAVAAVEAAARRQAEGGWVNEPRRRVRAGGRVMHVLAAGTDEPVAFGVKTYVSGGDGPVPFRYQLFGPDGLRAILEADHLGRLRTGAAGAVAARALAPAGASRLAIFGAGSQAESQVAALAATRPLTDVAVFARDPARREAFAARLREGLRLPARAAASAEAALEGAEIVVTVTSAREPLFEGARLAPGTHVNAVGSNRPTHREIDDALLRRCRVVAVEDVAQARVEAGDLLRAEAFDWGRAVRLCDLVAARADDASAAPPGAAAAPSAAGDLTLFESLGIGLWDLAVALEVVDRYEAERR